MTTAAAAKLYQAQHLVAVEGARDTVFNPMFLPLEDLPVIYGFNNGGSDSWFSGLLMAQDGTCLGNHISSSEVYMPHDLGVLEGSCPDRHETFRHHYPAGYRMEFVGSSAVKKNVGLIAAYVRNQDLGKSREVKS